MVTHPLQTCHRRERDPLRESADAQRRRRRPGLTRYTPITAANQPSNQPGAIAPPLPDELPAGAGVGVPTGLTVIVLPMVSVWPTLSVTVKVTVTLPAALVSNVAVAVLMALVKLAMPAPLVIAHW